MNSATTTRPLTPPLKWHGGKSYLAKKIIALMPPRCVNPNAPSGDDPGWLHYVEPYFGGGAVMLANDPEGISEVANDRYGRLMNFWPQGRLRVPGCDKLQAKRVVKALDVVLEAKAVELRPLVSEGIEQAEDIE